MVKVGDWVVCKCGTCNDAPAIVVAILDDRSVDTHLWYEPTGQWEHMSLHIFEARFASEQLRSKHIAAMLKGEIA